MQFKNLKELMIKFSDETVCRDYLEQRFWGGKPECPYCQYNEKIYRIEEGKRYKCKQCQKKFSIMVGTIFENSNIPMSTWFGAIYLITSHKKGISSIQLSKDLGVTQKTAWFILHRIREMMKDKSPDKLKNTVEIDETYVGGKEKNKHKSKRSKKSQGRGRVKMPVIGILQRDGKIHTEKLANTTSEQLLPIIDEKVDQSATIITDDLTAYHKLGETYDHFIINHSAGIYAMGNIHTNSIEGFWSQLKRGIIGIYHNVSYKHLNAYCNEFAFRYNTRKIGEQSRFDLSLNQAVGRRLKYDLLTYKYRYG